MGIKQTDVMSFLEPESVGFIYNTARAFLKRHADPEILLGQLKNLFLGGEIESCKDLIQLIIEEQHILSEAPELFILRAQIAFEQSDDPQEYKQWLKQAQLCPSSDNALNDWMKLTEAQSALKDGDYKTGEGLLHSLMDSEQVGNLALYVLAHHLFWKNIDTKKALELLEDIVQDRPHFVKAWACLGFVYNKLNFKAKAQYAFGQCIEFESNPEKIKFYKQQLAS
jgi:tetratricopeptide (TPR) repeat protein